MTRTEIYHPVATAAVLPKPESDHTGAAFSPSSSMLSLTYKGRAFSFLQSVQTRHDFSVLRATYTTDTSTIPRDASNGQDRPARAVRWTWIGPDESCRKAIDRIAR